MKILKVKSGLSDQSLQKIIKSQSDVRSLKGWLIIYNVQIYPRKTAKDIAQMLGVCRSMVYRIINLYNEYGKNWFSRCYCNQQGGRRETRCHLPLEAETLLMKSFEELALSGNILTFRHIKELVEDKVGKVVSDDYIWDLFQRHHWIKKVPRRQHPKADKAAQEEYKKNSKKIWTPNH